MPDLRDEGERGLLVLLHGDDDDPAACATLAARCVPGAGWASSAPAGAVVTPHGRAWWTADADGTPDASAFAAALHGVARTVAEARADGVPVVLGGFSQGAALVLALVARPQGDLDGVVGVFAVAGWLPDVPGVDLAPPKSRPPLLVAHGSDDAVVDVRQGRGAARYLERCGLDVTFLERATGHAFAPFVDDVRAWAGARVGT